MREGWFGPGADDGEEAPAFGLRRVRGALVFVPRPGRVLHLCAARTGSGVTRYLACRTPRGVPLKSLPAGYRLVLSVGGQLSIRREVPSPITERQLQTVAGVLAAHAHLAVHRIEVRGRTMIVHLPTETGVHAGWFRRHGLPVPPPEDLAPNADYIPVVRFVMGRGRTEGFALERRSAGRWCPTGHQGPLAELAATHLPLIGTGISLGPGSRPRGDREGGDRPARPTEGVAHARG